MFTTDAGKATRRLARKVSDQPEKVLLAPLSPQELSELNARLDIIADWLNSPEYRALTDKFHLAESALWNLHSPAFRGLRGSDVIQSSSTL